MVSFKHSESFSSKMGYYRLPSSVLVLSGTYDDVTYHMICGTYGSYCMNRAKRANEDLRYAFSKNVHSKYNGYNTFPQNISK